MTSTDHSATVTDNIFSNNTGYDKLSGNILTNNSDYFSQFLVINNSLRAKSKNVWFCCTLLEEKVEWFYQAALL